MANNLSAAQRTAFSGGSYDLVNFPVRASLFDGVSTTTEITTRVHSFGDTTVEVYNANPANPGRWVFPACSLRVKNDDGLFSPARAGAIWGSQSPAEFVLRLWVADLLTDPTGATLLEDDTFAVVDVQLEETEAFLVGVHPLARWWATLFLLEDRDSVDWNGYSHSYIMP